MKPILFNTEMVRAIQEARKTVTRRAVKYDFDHLYTAACAHGKWFEGYGTSLETAPESLVEWYVREIAKSPYHPGDILRVRETWCKYGKLDGRDQVIDGTEHYYYRADGENPTPFNDFLVQHPGWDEHRETPVWRPSIHMPKEAARLFLRVTGMRVERLQDLTITDLQDEGIQPEGYLTQYTALTSNFFERFRTLWNSTIKPADLSIYGWEANPWVWVIEFKRISREAALLGGGGDG